jgi:predicted metal-dependent hydrolase
MTTKNETGTDGCLEYRGDSIPYLVHFRNRKDLAIHVHPDRSVTVTAPAGTPIDAVTVRVHRRANWIVKQRRYFEQFQPLPPEPSYVSGETHRYLGRQYRLKIVTIAKPPESVKLIGRFLWVHTLNGHDKGRVQALVERWYRQRAHEVFERRMDLCLEAAKSLRITRPDFLVRKMVRRWGSFTRNKTILLNLMLVKAPVTCIDYVIMHELCHLREPNHSPGFFRLLSRVMPEWEIRKRRLESSVI